MTMAVIMWRGKQRWRYQMLLLGIVIMGIYLLLFRGHKGQHHDVTELEDIEDMDEDAVAEELANKKKVESVTYMPPSDDMHGWAASGGQATGRNKKNDTNLARTLKFHRTWSYAHSVISVHELWPDTPDVDTVLSSLQRARIVYVDTLDTEDFKSGTSEKWVVTLEGGQKAMMKLVWEPKIKGGMKKHRYCNFGFEMSWAEIAAFHLHRILGFRNTPYATGRVVDLRREILPVASPSVAAKLSLRGNKICVTGQCFHCEKTTTICPAKGLVETSIVYWVNTRLHLWTEAPQYMPFSTPREKQWGKYGFNDKTFCNKIQSEPPYDTLRYYHDIFDFAVIDTLMYHYDSKHYVVEDTRSRASGLTVRLDHGRAFCAHDKDNERVFLAPLNQCCILRRETYWSLKSLQPGVLTDRLKAAFMKDPIAPILKEEWYTALERRLQIVLKLADKCAAAVGGLEKMLVG